MDKHAASIKAQTLGFIIMKTLVTSAILITAAWWQNDKHERDAHTLAVNQSALAQKQHEVTALQSMIANQRLQIHELSSRCSTIQSVDAGPWTSYIATWYSLHDGIGDGTITKSGAKVRANFTVAVDPHIIPLGSIVEVKFPDGTDRIYKACDTGGNVIGHHIDIFDWNTRECRQNGVQTVMVRVLVKGR